MKRRVGLGVWLAWLLLLSPLSHSEAAPPWSLADAAGKQVDFPGDDPRPTILLFWATWCPFCKNLMPHLQSIVEEYGPESIRVLAVQVFDEDDARPFITERGYQFQLVPGGDSIAELYGIKGTPGLFLVDQYGDTSWHLGLTVKEVERRFGDSGERWQRAVRLAPFWAAELRQAIDRLPTAKHPE